MTKEEEFKQRFVSVLGDLRQSGTQDGETMALIGTLAAEIAVKLQQPSWSGAKSVLTRENYAELLGAFQRQGNEMHKAGETKKAYAIQALTVSLVAATQRQDPDIASGEGLLDAVIDRSVGLVLQASKNRPN